MTTDELIEAVMQWGIDHNLTDPKAQLNKVIEEVGEIAHEVTRNHYSSDELVDSIGDTLVTVIVLSQILDIDPRLALVDAYNVIKDRKGATKDGTFVKSE